MQQTNSGSEPSMTSTFPKRKQTMARSGCSDILLTKRTLYDVIQIMERIRISTTYRLQWIGYVLRMQKRLEVQDYGGRIVELKDGERKLWTGISGHTS
ncbi:hypothetical protein C0J52_27758 [Blattella germanica]|nr:hypothetical protein C0J52_27758 [Blattella germanica]